MSKKTFDRAQEALDKARKARNAEVMKQYKAGKNCADIGRALGMTRQRVSQLVNAGGAK